MSQRQFWIGVVSKDHVDHATAGGFAQVNHGKAGPLERMHAGDGFAFYSPRMSYPDGTPLQAFTAIGRVRTGTVYQAEWRTASVRSGSMSIPRRGPGPGQTTASRVVVHSQQDTLGRRLQVWRRARSRRRFRSDRRRHEALVRHGFRCRTLTPLYGAARLRYVRHDEGGADSGFQSPRRAALAMVAIAGTRTGRPLCRAGRAAAGVHGRQACAFLDADGYDFPAWHLLGWTTTHAAASRAAPLATSPATSLVTYLRVLDPGSKYAEPSIGRVLTVPPWRRLGIGRVVMQEGIARCKAAWPGQPIRIAAQQRLEAFYASLAFRVASPPYIEDGIPHVDSILAGQ